MRDQVARDASGWPHHLRDDKSLARLLALHGERAAAQGAAPAQHTDHKDDSV